MLFDSLDKIDVEQTRARRLCWLTKERKDLKGREHSMCFVALYACIPLSAYVRDRVEQIGIPEVLEAKSGYQPHE